MKAKRGLAPLKTTRRLGFERLCRLADAHALSVELYAKRDGSVLWLMVRDGADGRSEAEVAGAEKLDLAAARVLGQLAEAGIR